MDTNGPEVSTTHTSRSTFEETDVLTVAFDADDTLWHTEDLYHTVEREYDHLLAPWADPPTVQDRLHQVQMKNLPLFGYGAKSFTLSMIEAAIEISDNRIDATTVATIVAFCQRLLTRRVELIEGVEDVLEALRPHRLMVITKGDVHDQRSKVERSGLKQHFWRVEVVAHKNSDAYNKLLRRHGIDRSRFVMVGNSLRSDVLPVLELGGSAVHIPYPVTWRHEEHVGAVPADIPTLESLSELPGWLQDWHVVGRDGSDSAYLANPAGSSSNWRTHLA